MPLWAGKWKGGRYYIDDGHKVFFIEKMLSGVRYTLRLDTHDEDLAVGEFARFLTAPQQFIQSQRKPDENLAYVYITKDRIARYLENIRHTVEDHKKSREFYLNAWADKRIDLKAVTRQQLRDIAASWVTARKTRVEALNTFCRFLVKEGELPSWIPLTVGDVKVKPRAVKEAYTIEQLVEKYRELKTQAMKDLLVLKASTGMHYTEIAQLKTARATKSALPERGVWIRRLDGKHEIKGVLQVIHKSGHFHRQSVDEMSLRAAERLTTTLITRVAAYENLLPLTMGNLRHTFITLAGECGRLVTYTGGGVARSSVAQVVGHRAGSTMTSDRYEKLQIPPMIVLPIEWS